MRASRSSAGNNPQLPQVAFGRFDFLEEGSSAGVVRAAMAAFGRIDILVNNAAIRVRRPFGEFTAQEFDQVVGVNLRAPFLLSQEVVPIMKRTAAAASSISQARWAASPSKTSRSTD